MRAKQDMDNKKNKKEILMPNGFKVKGNIPYYAEKRLEGIACEIANTPKRTYCCSGGMYYGRAEKVHTRQKWEIGKNSAPRTMH